MPTSAIPRLSTKLTPPALMPHEVARHAAELASSGSARVVLVRAPAGFGKSTFLSQVYRAAEQRGESVAWLTLDALDNDVSRLVYYLAELMSLAGVSGARSNDPVDLMDAIATHTSPFTLFLDDLDTLHHAGALSVLREMIERLPRGGQLVLGCRSWPDLGFGRLRARGQLAEIGPDQLRFSLDETRSFLSQRSYTLSEHSTVMLQHRCEGWAAGLWLASLALRRRENAAAFAEEFSGSDQALAEYLAEDVLAGESSEVQEFLLRTSILKQLTEPTCAAVHPGIDCAAMLEHLSTNGVFLTRIGDSPPTWRYHSLFASFLRSRLEQRADIDPHQLHRSASLAYEADGRPVPAIDHAVLAGDKERAIALLADHADTFLAQGRLRLLDRWCQAIGPALRSRHARLMHLSLWAVCFTRGPLETLSQMGMDDAAHPPPDAEISGAAHLSLRAMLLALQDRYADAFDVGQRALAALPSDLPFADSSLLNLMANIASILGVPEESRKLLQMARTRFGASTFNRMYAESLEGMLDLFEARMRQAGARFRIAVEATHQATFNQSHGNAWAGVLYAYAKYEANQLDKAEHLTNIYLPMARDVGLPDHMILSHALRARIAFTKGDVDSALHTINELEHLGHLRQLPRVVCSARLERARIFMQQDNARAAREEIDRATGVAEVELTNDYRLLAQEVDYPALAELRWHVCHTDAAAAAARAQSLITQAESTGRHRRALKLRLLLAVALHRGGHLAAALTALVAVLETANREGMVRLVLDEAPWINALLSAYLCSTQEGVQESIDPIYADFLHALQSELQLRPDADAAPEPLPELVEPLTRKELLVLQLLAEGYSNSAIAEKMVVADTTVRTHLRHINMKLNATSRTQAVALARRLRLIA